MSIITENEMAFKERFGHSLRMIKNGSRNGSIEANAGETEGYPSYDTSVPEDVRFLIIFGIGNGEYIMKLYDREQSKARMIVYEPEMTEFTKKCEKWDLSRIICDRGVGLVIGDGSYSDHMVDVIRSLADALNINHIFLKVTEGYGDRYPGILSSFAEKIKEYLIPVAADLQTEVTYTRGAYQNELYALSVLGDNYLVGELFAKISDKSVPIVLVGAGPSLKKNIALLEQAKGKAIIIACTRALELLEQYEIQADLLAMVDMDEGHDYCEKDPERKYYVLFSARSAKDIQKNYQGKGIYFSFDHRRFPVRGLEKEIGVIDTGGSVITGIFSLFVQAGFTEFILIGEDLAYAEDGKSHATHYKKEENKETRYQTEGIDGSLVWTRGDWLVFKEFIEIQIRKNPGIHVTDATEGGARIRGTEIVSLKEVLDNLDGRCFPIEEWISSIRHTEKSISGEVYELFQSIIRDCDAMQLLLNDAIGLNEQVCNNWGKANRGDFSRICEQYDSLYKLILREDTAKSVKGYCSDLIFSYSDKAQYLNNDSNVIKRLELERWFFEEMGKRCSELKDYVQGLKIR